MSVLVLRAGVFRGWESNSDSEEDVSDMGFFTTGFVAGFDFWGLAAYGEGVCERGRGGSCELPRHLLRPWR